ncbi:MAG TPA: SIS domain-containing protein [Ktedonobacterales bacterium]
MSEEEVPAWRDAPPWLMEEMVASEPALARATAGCRESAERLADRLRAAVANGEPIVVTGCGTSEHGARAIGDLLEAALRAQGQPGGRVVVRQALEAALDPRGGLCIGVSHDGATRATILALEANRAAGGTTALITGRAGAPAAAVADELCVTPLRDRSWCHTVAYLSSILIGGLVADALGGSGEPRLDLPALGDYVEATLALRAQADAIAAALHGSAYLIASGLGSDVGVARELALKVEEGVRTPATLRDAETLLHGHLAACDQHTGVVMFATDPRNGERAKRRLVLAAQAARRVGAQVAAIVSPECAQMIPSAVTTAGQLVLPAGEGLPPLLAALTGPAVAAQMVTLGLIERVGVNPDWIRREQEPYRAAAAIAEGAADW